MNYCIVVCLVFILSIVVPIKTDAVLGCGGFIISDSSVPIDFSKIEIKLLTKQGILKDKTSCAPNNGYYFIPLYDKGEYTLELQPPPGWSFEPTMMNLVVDGVSDLCSQGKDINFNFKGFGITGKVESFQNKVGPAGVTVHLKASFGTDTRTTVSSDDGSFFFTPVIPGRYIITVFHNKWKFLKNSVAVQVAEGNTELPSETLVVAGYDVTGYIKSKIELISNIQLILYQTEGDKKRIFVDGCDKTIIKHVEQSNNQLCHVSANKDGLFIFPIVSPGEYFIVPYCKEQNVHFSPSVIEIEVGHDSVIIKEAFQIVGFSVSGIILNSKNGRPLMNAKVILNDNQITNTKEDGSYTFQNITVASHKLKVIADHMEFEETTLEVNPIVLQFPSLFPSKYQICGNVVSDNPQTVVITSLDSDESFITNSSPIKKGTFCKFLNPGKYKLQVSVSESEKSQGVQFYPASHFLDVVSSPIFGITFSELKATVIGKINCINESDCRYLKVVLQSSDNKDLVADVNILDGTYKFEDVVPGNYKLLLSSNQFCWEKDSYDITVNSTLEKVSEFVQNGYSVLFVSSHDARAKYSIIGKTKSIDINKGNTQYCLPHPGKYVFNLESCHTYEFNEIEYNTYSDINEIYLTALKHDTTVTIKANENHHSVYISINISNEITEEELIRHGNNYILTLSLAPTEEAILTPISDILYFKPTSVLVKGMDDCVDQGVKFIAENGKVFQGMITPPIADVLLTIKKGDGIITTYRTTETGNYKFPPLDTSEEYTISAEKETYVLLGPDPKGNFVAQKLAEIIVSVLDKTDNSSLQGAFLSLSGDKSYRSNLQTNEDGKIIFHSLNPSEYFLRPMMKEYSFEPNSVIINIKEGETQNFILKGKRVAYSGFGFVSSLNGESEEKVIVIASGLSNCSHFSEEATSELNGQFRIRGLQPYCLYNVKIKNGLYYRRPIERSTPSAINISITNEDISNLRFTVFRPLLNMDLMLHVYSEQPDIYKYLKIKLARESPPTTVLHTAKLDNLHLKLIKDNNAGIIINLPSLPLDNKQYSIQLEGPTQTSRIKAHTQYFTANESFRYFEMEYIIKNKTIEHNLKQTSLWTLILVFGSLVGLYNAEKTVQIMQRLLSKLRSGKLNTLASNSSKKPTSNEYTIDNNEIDQLVQSINATKRKLKPKKI